MGFFKIRNLYWRHSNRIGDGFYEQQLLADQILKQTGKRHLEGYTDDESAFRALMDAGIAYAKKMNLTPGISLSDLRGGVIGSEASADKNCLLMGTFSFSDSKNEADYRAKSVGASYRKYGDYNNMTQEQKNHRSCAEYLHARKGRCGQHNEICCCRRNHRHPRES